jgi:hypothetical protein
MDTTKNIAADRRNVKNFIGSSLKNYQNHWITILGKSSTAQLVMVTTTNVKKGFDKK